MIEFNTWLPVTIRPFTAKTTYIKAEKWVTSGDTYGFRLLEGYGVNDDGDGPVICIHPKPRYYTSESSLHKAVIRRIGMFGVTVLVSDTTNVS